MHAGDNQKAYDLMTEAISKSPTPDARLHSNRANALIPWDGITRRWRMPTLLCRSTRILLLRTTQGERPSCDLLQDGRR